jgi:hypothetical protein
VSDKFNGDVRFKVIQFVVNGLDRNGDVVLMTVKGMMNGGGTLENDFKHESHQGGKKEVLLVLFFGGFIKKSVELIRWEEALEDRSHENGEGRFLFKTVENVIVSTHGDSFQVRQFGKITKFEERNRNKFLATWEGQINYSENLIPSKPWVARVIYLLVCIIG